MDYTIKHYPDINRFEAHINGLVAYIEYQITNDIFDIIHTIVPKELEGQGIAASIVKEAYTYAKSKNYKLKGSCSYANVWLLRHPM